VASSVRLFQVNDQWFYSTSIWKAVVGPFNSLLEATQALEFTLRQEHGIETTPPYTVEEV
jgi:hypothetical protein